ncbi:MAG: glycosyltransferase family 4 protein [Victivallaceae bacterium]|nr:glycosyltransferase family 4 protein [Victivallaceae bacterium]
MRILLASFKYSPYGGLERDMLRLARHAADAGHQVTICTGSWHGERPAGIDVVEIPVGGMFNHGRAVAFDEAFAKAKQDIPHDVCVAFNRISGCDFYFAADNCYAASMPRKHLQLTLKLLPRYRAYLALERKALAPPSNTIIFHLTDGQKRDYQRAYGVPDSRFILLPPAIGEGCARRQDADMVRLSKREELDLNDNQLLMLFVGSNFKQKGADRVLCAVASLPYDIRSKTKVMFVGNSPSGKFKRMAERLDVSSNAVFCGGRTDVPELLQAADLAVLPARNEATGTFLAEAIAAGLPAICSSDCGYCDLVEMAGGAAVPEPWNQELFNALMFEYLMDNENKRKAAIGYSATVNYGERAAVELEAMEKLVSERK